MFSKRKTIRLLVIGSILILSIFALLKYPEWSVKKEESKTEVTAQVTIIEENDKKETEDKKDNNNESQTENKNNETNEDVSKEDSNKQENPKIPVDNLKIEHFASSVDSMGYIEMFSTMYSINNDVTEIKKEYIEQIGVAIKQGLEAKSEMLNGKITDYEIKDIVKYRNNTGDSDIIVVTGIINNKNNFFSIYAVNTYEGKDVLEKSLEELKIANDILGSTNKDSASNMQTVMQETIQKYENWHGSIALTLLESEDSVGVMEYASALLFSGKAYTKID